MPVGFGAAKIHKKSSRLNQRRTNTNELNARQKSRANSPGLSEAGYKKNISHSPDDGTETASPKTRMEN